MTPERLKEIRAAVDNRELLGVHWWWGDALADTLAEVDRLRAAAELVQVALENNHMAMVVLVYGRELGLWK